jgi:hypothetical protein
MRKCINESNRNFSKEEVKMAQKHEEIFNIPGLKEALTKTALRFHLTSIRVAIIKNTNNN